MHGQSDDSQLQGEPVGWGHDQRDDDSDADAFAVLSLMLIVALTVVYFIANQ